MWRLALPYVRHALKTVVIFTHDLKSVCRLVGCRVCVGFVPPSLCSVACNGWTFIFFLLYREKWQQPGCSSIAAKERRRSIHRLLSLDVSVINFYESTSAAWKRCRFDRERRPAMPASETIRTYAMARWNSSSRCRFTFRQISKPRIFKHFNLSNRGVKEENLINYCLVFFK